MVEKEKKRYSRRKFLKRTAQFCGLGALAVGGAGTHLYISGSHSRVSDSQQEKYAQNEDALLVLGGGKKYMSRTDHACGLYFSVKESRNNPLYIVFSGLCSGLRLYTGKPLNERKDAVSRFMESYAHKKGVPSEVTKIEDQSLDTVANMIYSQPILEEMGAKKIGLVTDKFHMERAYCFAQRVFGGKYQIHPLATDRDTSVFGRITQGAVSNAVIFDISNIESGNQEAFEDYLKTKHPFHALQEGNKPPMGTYKLGITLMSYL